MHTNRLSLETSPYLLQHQHNPVDWYPWGPEAFEAARKSDKPIFLSVGYSTCYWCHVMERQCFENPEIAKLMNEKFINIKVDREERPDVDQLYMTAVQVITRQGGWPMSVWLTPDLKPFYGGTYFPPTDSYGRPGFAQILNTLSQAYHEQQDQVEESAEKIHHVLKELSLPVEPDQEIVFSTNWLDVQVGKSIDDYEREHGGFGRAPKFPRQTLLELLLYWINYQRATGFETDRVEKPLRHTLDAMANGGIRDHLGGAFHRYSTDNKWLVPHFEIMLYDNAMLAWVYAEASRVFNEPRYETVARGILDFVLESMTSPDGAFYTAWDAEVDGQEGLNYLWTIAEIEQVLSPRDAARFAAVYGVDSGPNFADPHHGNGTPDKNILYLPHGPEFESSPEIMEMRKKLYAHRNTRKKPLLDTKILTSWNALMIRALAHAGDLFGDARYLEAASRATNFLLTVHATSDGGLYRTSRDGVKKYDAFIDDYAFLAQALLELHRVTRDPFCFNEAKHIVHEMQGRFEDIEHGGFFYTDISADDLLVRQKIGNDSPLPCGNSVAAMVCDAVGETGSAARALAIFAVQTAHHASSMSTHVQAILQFVQNHGEMRVSPSAGGRLRIDAPQDQAVRFVEISHGWKGEKQIMIQLTIAPGYHLSAETGLESTTDLIEHIAVPPPVRKKFAYADQEQLVLEGTLRILVILKQPPDPGTVIPLRITYQVCNDSLCLPVVTRGISVVR